MICGLDLSLRSTGVALISEQEPMTWTITSKPPQTVIEVAQLIVKQVLSIAQRDKEVTFFIEDYSFGKFGTSSSVTALIELTGIITYELHKNNLTYFKIPPTILKKYLTGKGNAKKEQMLVFALEKYGIHFNSSDECDAFALADLGLAFLTGKNLKGKNLDKKILDFMQKL